MLENTKCRRCRPFYDYRATVVISIPHCSFSLLASEMSSSLQPSWLNVLFVDLQNGRLDPQYEHPCLQTASGIQRSLVSSQAQAKCKESVWKLGKEYCGCSGSIIRKNWADEGGKVPGKCRMVRSAQIRNMPQETGYQPHETGYQIRARVGRCILQEAPIPSEIVVSWADEGRQGSW